VTQQEMTTPPAAQAAPQHEDQPANRWLAILYILFCFEVGVFLFMLPWVPFWSRNFFVGRFHWVSAIVTDYFVRGAVSGIGLADVFLAFQEIWRLRRPLGMVHPRPVHDGKP
jgi:hypothetical protein